MVHQKIRHILKESYPSDKKKRKSIVDSLCKQIATSSTDMAITAEELYLSLDEAITNAMEHGNTWDPRKTVDVTVTTDRKNMSISIADQGKGFDTKDIKASLKSRDILSTRGRGLYIINQFCDISWNKKGNEIILHIKRGK
jgi:serine/threonine-protein kinase RsbW